ncbi:MAG: chitobiase/beta-hexosaminidase C-terminal domain-containing protein [Candidatus Wallbacteria bacterium]
MFYNFISRNVPVIFLFLIIMLATTGCGGSDSAVSGGGAVKIIEVEGKIQVPSVLAPAQSSKNNAPGFSNIQNSFFVVNADNPDTIIGSVMVNGDSYTASIPAGAAAVTPKLVIKNNARNRILYQCMFGKIPASSEIPDKVKKIKLSGIVIDENSTARALLVCEKKLGLLSIISTATAEIQASNETLNLNYENKKIPSDDQIEKNCGGAALVSELAKAVKTVSVVADSSVAESFKISSIPVNISNISELLNAFTAVAGYSGAQSVITQNQLSTSITVAGTVINSSSNQNGSIPELINKIIPLEKAARPKFNLEEGFFNYTTEVLISCDTPGAVIKYYLEYPGINSLANFNIYDGNPIKINSTVTITAVALKDGMSDSDTAKATYTIDKIAPVLTQFEAVSDNSTNIYSARAGNTIKLTFTVNEPLGGMPGIKINGHIVNASKIGGENYMASYLMTTDEVEGPVNYSIIITDLAGNVSQYYRNANINYYKINSISTLNGYIIYGNTFKTDEIGINAQAATVELRKKIEPNSYPLFSTSTSKTGYFSFSNLLPGDYILSAVLKNDSSKTVLKNETIVTIAAETPEYIMEKPLELRNASTLEITVTDASGALLQSARVFLNDIKNQYTDKKGKVSFVELTEGVYKVEVIKEGFINKLEYVTAGETDRKLTFVLSPANPEIKTLSVSDMLINKSAGQVYEGDTISISVASDNPNNASLKFKWQVSGGYVESTSEIVAGNLIKSEIKWVAPVMGTDCIGLAKNYSISAAVEDGKSPSTSRTVMINVAKKSAAQISITSTPLSAAALNSVYNYKITVTDENANIINPSKLSYDIKSNPSVENNNSFKLAKDSGEITWQPSVRGKFDFILKVADTIGGNYAIQQFSVKVDDYIDELKSGETFSKTVLKPGSGLAVTLKNLKTSEYVITMPYNTSETAISAYNMSFYKTNADNSIPKLASCLPPARSAGLDQDAYGDKMVRQMKFEINKRKRDFEFLRQYGKYIDYGGNSSKAPLKQAYEPVLGSETYFMVETPDRSVNNGWVKVPAMLMAYGKHCYIYVEKDIPANYMAIDSASAKKFAESFDADYEKITSTFGSEPNPGLDGDSRVYVFATHYVNLQDAAGYFSFYDTMTQKRFDEMSDPGLCGNNGTGQKYYSNEKEMFYIFLPAADFNGPNYNRFISYVLEHEFQHMINFYQHSLLIEDFFNSIAISYDAFLSYLWLNEGMSMYSADSCGYKEIFTYYRYFLLNVENHSLLSFVNYENYGLSHLFVKYLVEQGAVPANLVKSEKIDIKNAEAEIISKNIAVNFDEFYVNFISTLYLSNTGITSDTKYNYRNANLRATVEAYGKKYLLNGPSIVAEMISPASYNGVCQKQYSFNVIKCAASEQGDHKLTLTGTNTNNTGMVILRIKK